MIVLSIICLVLGYLLGIRVVALVGWVLLGIALLLLLIGSIGGAYSYGLY